MLCATIGSNRSCSFQKESPRWLINKGQLSAAHRIVFGRPLDKGHKDRIADELAKQRQSIVSVLCMPECRCNIP